MTIAPTTRPSLGDLFGLAWPIVVSRSAQVVVGFTDAAMVARLGEAELGAATAGSLNVMALLIFPMGAVYIVSSFVSQLVGRGDAGAGRRFGFYGLLVALAAQLACFVALPFLGEAVGLMRHPPEVAALLGDYLFWRLTTGGAVVGLEALGNYYAGINKTSLPMFAQIFAMVLNVALNWVLIYGHLGAPALGVRGAAIASAVSTAIAFLALLVCFLRRVGAPKGPAGKLSVREIKRVVVFGTPAGLNWFLEFAAFVFFVDIVVADLGTAPLAAMMAVFQINSLSFMPAFAVASAGAVFVGQAIGAKKHDDVAVTVRLTLGVNATWQGCVALLYLAIPALLLKPFQSPEAGAVFLATGMTVLRLSAAWQLFDAVANTFAEVLRAAGDTKFTSLARAAIAWFVFTPGAWISVRIYQGGTVAATLWLVLYLAILAGALYLRYRSGRWRDLELVEPTVAPEPR